MAKINNYRRLELGEFSGENAQLAQTLGEILNPFMREVTDVINGNIDFDNLSQNILTIDIAIGPNGKPVSNQVNTGNINPKGFQVIRAINKTSPTIPVQGQPFITYSALGNGIVNISNISNLEANNTYQLTLVVY